jgi:hypothetical protein
VHLSKCGSDARDKCNRVRGISYVNMETRIPCFRACALACARRHTRARSFAPCWRCGAQQECCACVLVCVCARVREDARVCVCIHTPFLVRSIFIAISLRVCLSPSLPFSLSPTLFPAPLLPSPPPSLLLFPLSTSPNTVITARRLRPRSSLLLVDHRKPLQAFIGCADALSQGSCGRPWQLRHFLPLPLAPHPHSIRR